MKAAPTLAPSVPFDAGPSSLRPASASGLYVDELFEQISALPPSEREAMLAERCAGHPSLELEVRALLRAADDELEPREPGPVLIGPGARVGRYRLEHPLGSGATASVWKAFDTRLHSFTALKLLHPDGRVRGTNALEAVLHEARAASGIISDHVVRIKTAGRIEGGPHFVEMELCAEHRPGPDGAEILEIGRSLADTPLDSVREKVRVVAEAARGVDAAHRVGVLHRDLKPGNILLTPVSRRAKVTDFGLAAEQLFSPPTEETPATQTVTVILEAVDGRIVGTPAFMPPEQALGQPPTRAGDVYGLGATLYALVAGRSPYVAGGRHPMPALDVLAQVRAGPPRPLAAVAAVPSRLARVVEKAMARSPRERYRTAADLATDLELWLAERPTSIDGAAPLLRPYLFARRNREVVGTLAVLLVVVVAFAAAVGWLDLRRRELEGDIGSAQRELTEVRAEYETAKLIRDRTEAEKQKALQDLEDAEAARVIALEGESNAERRWREELERRKAAEQARTLAEEARNAAEAERAAAAAARDTAMAEAEAGRVALADAVARSDEREAARLAAEDALRQAEIARNETAMEIADLKIALAKAEAARIEAEQERDELQRGIAALAGSVPEPEPEPEAAPAPEPTEETPTE